MRLLVNKALASEDFGHERKLFQITYEFTERALLLHSIETYRYMVVREQMSSVCPAHSSIPSVCSSSTISL